jgi:hypothetical protein
MAPAIARAILGPKKSRRGRISMFGIYNITSGKKIVKSTLFCKVRFVFYSGINSYSFTDVYDFQDLYQKPYREFFAQPILYIFLLLSYKIEALVNICL